MDSEPPLAFFLTWTVYGTFLQGDVRGWRKRGKGHQPPQPLLAEWRQERLLYPIALLNREQREVVKAEIDRLCGVRRWTLWARDARSNHVHGVITAHGMTGKKVRNELKANCTRVLRARWPTFCDRPVWTKGGDWQCLNSEEELEQAIAYVLAQDRMHLK